MILFDIQLKECLVPSVTSVVGAMFALMVPSVTISVKANAGSKEVCQSRIKLIYYPLTQSYQRACTPFSVHLPLLNRLKFGKF